MGVADISPLIDQGGAVQDQRWPCCTLYGMPWADRQQQRCQAIATLGLAQAPCPPAWEEATQQVARFLAVPMVVVTVADHHTEYFRAAYGLPFLGLGNPLSQERQLPLPEGLGSYILDSGAPLVLPDTLDNPLVAQSTLVTTYGIRAYCGVPLMTAQGLCLGTLAAMDTGPRSFSDRDLAFLAMAARWGMSEYERQRASGNGSAQPPPPPAVSPDTARLALTNRLTQTLRTPLSTVMGMATMLSREIYGPLTPKQREYNDIVQRSSQVLLGMVDEILDLCRVDPLPEPAPTPVDIALLGQQVIATLVPMAEERGQTLSLTVEPNEHHWVLDQHLVKHMLYHLLFSLMQLAGDNSTLRLHACRRGQMLDLGLWLSNPWLGEGLPPEVLDAFQPTPATLGPVSPSATSPNLVGLQLGQQLAAAHGGQLKVQGDADSGCRLVLVLPTLGATHSPSVGGHGL